MQFLCTGAGRRQETWVTSRSLKTMSGVWSGSSGGLKLMMRTNFVPAFHARDGRSISPTVTPTGFDGLGPLQMVGPSA
ncbi:MAG: hypothetical protein Ct9H300mP7_2030 [Verrucomicrobiota bacterium]|nr:MAG: hypothetical protein Ct9H300mP7_2030 [Verrucomicrobiota bacterium]